MEKNYEELLMSVLPVNPEAKKLYDTHRKLERQVENLDPYTTYSSAAALRQKELKKQKLQKMERLMKILEGYKGSPPMM